jgi:hypothetical protein
MSKIKKFFLFVGSVMICVMKSPYFWKKDVFQKRFFLYFPHKYRMCKYVGNYSWTISGFSKYEKLLKESGRKVILYFQKYLPPKFFIWTLEMFWLTNLTLSLTTVKRSIMFIHFGIFTHRKGQHLWANSQILGTV